MKNPDQYWDRSLSWVDGCTPCSPGCDHCWSAAMAHRFYREHLTTTEGKFNGHVVTRPDRLEIPLKRKKPTVYAAWNDLWHESVPDDFQYRVLEIMSSHECERHTFLVLTKRPHVALAFYNEGYAKDLCLNNVYHGLTICNQQEADEKIPIFLQVPGKKFLSIEPMLAAIDLLNLPRPFEFHQSPYGWPKWLWRKLDIVILGGETGPGARPMHPDWVRSVRDQCAAAGVPFFFKQWGGVNKKKAGRLLEARNWDGFPRLVPAGTE